MNHDKPDAFINSYFLANLKDRERVTDQVMAELASWQAGTALAPKLKQKRLNDRRHENDRIHNVFGELRSQIGLSSNEKD